MNYPTMEEVEQADRVQLARWTRFLPSPGSWAVGVKVINFESVLAAEARIMNRISDRFKEAGGMTPQISKQIEW